MLNSVLKRTWDFKVQHYVQVGKKIFYLMSEVVMKRIHYDFSREHLETD